MQIQGQIRLVLEDSQLALSLETHAARRRVGDATVGEPDARIGNIDLLGEYRRAHGIDALNRCADDRLYDVDVVDHQIQDDVHVCATLAIGSEAVAFDETR